MDNYLPAENDMMGAWFEYVKEFGGVQELSQDEQLEEGLRFNQFCAAIYPKYMQIALFDLAEDMKIEPVVLGDEYFQHIPASSLNNHNIDDFRIFRNFTVEDMELEVIRAVKFQELQELARREYAELREDEEFTKDLTSKTEQACERLLKTETPKFIID